MVPSYDRPPYSKSVGGGRQLLRPEKTWIIHSVLSARGDAISTIAKIATNIIIETLAEVHHDFWKTAFERSARIPDHPSQLLCCGPNENDRTASSSSVEGKRFGSKAPFIMQATRTSLEDANSADV